MHGDALILQVGVQALRLMEANGYLLEHAVLDQDWYVFNDLATWRRRQKK